MLISAENMETQRVGLSSEVAITEDMLRCRFDTATRELTLSIEPGHPETGAGFYRSADYPATDSRQV